MSFLPRSPLVWLAMFIAMLLVAPIATIAWSVFQPAQSDVWEHLVATVMHEYVLNSLILMLVVGTGTVLFGVSSAWLVAMHRFPGSRWLEWMLILPLAMPAYVVAYAYTDFLQFTGPVQTWLRQVFAWEKSDYWFPEVHNVWGAAAMFILVLYPYVYLLARTAFLERGAALMEASRTLGRGYLGAFWHVTLPMARPAIAAGATLAVMEALADFGAVSYFNVQTFTTGIYRAWFAFGDRIAAAQLAASLLGFVLLALALERLSRGRRGYAERSVRAASPTQTLSGARGWLATLWCLTPLVLGFFLPAGILLELAMEAPEYGFEWMRYRELIANSFVLAGGAAVLSALIAVLLAYGVRLGQGAVAKGLNRLVSLGYATPGSVIAVGVLIPVTFLDNALASWWEAATGVSTGLLLTGGIAALVYAYLVRFQSIALQTVEASLGKVTRSMDDAARNLGLPPWKVLLRVHAPILAPGMLTAVLLVFVDVMKELPATLVMRPFNFNTLATQVYTLAADERLNEAAVPSLTIVVVAMIPVMFLARTIAASRK